MNTPKHTPGPWKVSTTYAQAEDGKADVTTWAQQTIARVQSEDFSPGENLYNACLIAAAPELLGALKATLAALEEWIEIADDDDQRQSDHDAVNLAKLAIAKAEGNQ